jgi:hypothetical protein
MKKITEELRLIAEMSELDIIHSVPNTIYSFQEAPEMEPVCYGKDMKGNVKSETLFSLNGNIQIHKNRAGRIPRFIVTVFDNNQVGIFNMDLKKFITISPECEVKVSDIDVDSALENKND